MDFLNFLAQYRTPAGDAFFQAVTYCAQELLVVAFICWFFWCGRKNLAYKLGFSFFLSGLTVQGLKIFCRIPRPWVLDPDFKAVPSALPGATGYSFPSGHTQSATSFLTALAFETRRRFLKFFCVLGFLLVGFSRMYLGVHTPKDVLTSMAITLILTSLVCVFWHHFENDTSHDAAISLALACLSLVLLVCDFLLVRSGLLDVSNALDCCKACGAGLAFSIGFYLERRFIRFQAPESLRGKLIRFLAGVSVAMILEFGLKYLLPASMPAAWLRYFLIVIWILAVYPWLFTRFAESRH